jgi:hypothetical protein
MKKLPKHGLWAPRTGQGSNGLLTKNMDLNQRNAVQGFQSKNGLQRQGPDVAPLEVQKGNHANSNTELVELLHQLFPVVALDRGLDDLDV